MKPKVVFSPFFKKVVGSVASVPSPVALSSMWNFGSLLGLMLMSQIMTGAILAAYFTSDDLLAFWSIMYIMRDVDFGWFFRMAHLNGASVFFFCLYTHLGRNIFFMSYFKVNTWCAGIVILIFAMLTAFVGYVLPWGQMSFWGATVITTLLGAIPEVGMDMLHLLWGGFAVGNPTLSRFFSMHFIMPFLMAGFVIIHLSCLHSTGSSNPLGLNANFYKIKFDPYFFTKDVIGGLGVLLFLYLVVTYIPWVTSDPENFFPANPVSTPLHIRPEWYFLFAYAILRSITSKLGGIVALSSALLVLFIFPLSPRTGYKGSKFFPLNKIFFWPLLPIFIILSIFGAVPVEAFFLWYGKVFSVIYFSWFFIYPIIPYTQTYHLKF